MDVEYWNDLALYAWELTEYARVIVVVVLIYKAIRSK
jgi:hypothetical protein